MGIGNFLVCIDMMVTFFSSLKNSSPVTREKKKKFPFSIFRIEIGAQKFSFVQRVRVIIYKAICINFFTGQGNKIKRRAEAASTSGARKFEKCSAWPGPTCWTINLWREKGAKGAAKRERKVILTPMLLRCGTGESLHGRSISRNYFDGPKKKKEKEHHADRWFT